MPSVKPFHDTTIRALQVATILRCFSTGDELVRAAALLFTRAADLEENIGALTSAMQVRMGESHFAFGHLLMSSNASFRACLA